MGVMVGRWDCRYCGHKGNLGPETKCSSCSAPRNPDVKFYLPEDAEYTTDKEMLKRAEAEADWTCAFCGSDNPATQEQCESCGHKREKSDTLREQREYSSEEVPHSDEEARGIKPPPEKPKKGKKGLFAFRSIFGIIIAVVAFIFYPRSTTVEVTSHSWTRTLDIENYREVKEEGWNIPSGGTMIREYQAEHHKKKVLDHYEERTRTKKVKIGTEKYVCGKKDLGNGLFKDKYCTSNKYETRTEKYKEPIYRQEPVYQTKYVYRIYRWVVHKTTRKTGNDKNPQWPDEGAPGGDDWREGKKTETYVLTVRDKKNKFHGFKVPLNVWQKYNVGDQLPAKRNLLGKVELNL